MPASKKKKVKKSSKRGTKQKAKGKKKKTFRKIRYFDDLLASKHTSEDRLNHLMVLSNVSFKLEESRASIIEKIMYESVLGLDEATNILYTEDELRKICNELGIIGVENRTKSNLIGILLKHLPAKRKRKIETIIEENIEEEKELHIHNIFLIHPDGCCLYSYNLEPISIGDVQIVTSALNAIDSLIREITRSKQRLDSIDIKEKELIFEYGKLDLAKETDQHYPKWNLIGVLLLNQDSALARSLLREVVTKFEQRFENYLYDFDGCLDVFESADDIIREVFDFYF
ncbi:MAG: hypothetical protein ACTSRW_07710 [Candidatus Helarchaeota archaeon]